MPFSTGLMYSFGTDAADDLVHELEALARLGRLDRRIFTWPYWPRPPVCADVLAFGFRRLADRFAVGHLRLADIGVHAELALHAVDDDLQVQLAHAGDNRLPGFRIGRHAAAWDPPAASFWIAMPSFSWSALVFGSIAS